MSSKRSKLDLLVRVRYQNPIPPPSFPPLLVDIATDLSRLARPDFVTHYAASVPLPMMVDSEIGMPLDLNVYDGIWSGETRAIIPTQQSADVPKDDLILFDPPSRNPALAVPLASQSSVQAGSLKQNYHKPEVSWLRTTTYSTRDSGAATALKRGMGSSSSVGAAGASEPEIDASMQAQLQAIERTFWYHDQYSFDPAAGDLKEEDILAKIRHPNKKHLKAVETFDILPEDELWGINLNRVDYPERPAGKSGEKTSDVQLSYNLFKPYSDEHRKFGELYMPQEDQEDVLRQVRAKLLPSEEVREAEKMEDFPTAKLGYVRDYEITQENPNPNEFVLSFFDGSDPKDDILTAGQTKAEGEDEEEEDDIFGDKELEDDEPKDKEELRGKRRKRERGIYYSPIVNRAGVKKRRVIKDKSGERQGDALDAIEVAFEPVPETVEATIRSKAESIVDPDWVERYLQKGLSEAETAGEAMGADDGTEVTIV